jgi:hypothetical protein
MTLIVVVDNIFVEDIGKNVEDIENMLPFENDE